MPSRSGNVEGLHLWVCLSVQETGSFLERENDEEDNDNEKDEKKEINVVLLVEFSQSLLVVLVLHQEEIITILGVFFYSEKVVAPWRTLPFSN